MTEPRECSSWYSLSAVEFGMCTMTGKKCTGREGCKWYRDKLEKKP